jgi:hypothetical protein
MLRTGAKASAAVLYAPAVVLVAELYQTPEFRLGDVVVVNSAPDLRIASDVPPIGVSSSDR